VLVSEVIGVGVEKEEGDICLGPFLVLWMTRVVVGWRLVLLVGGEATSNVIDKI
jgi:hypothetical protein